MSYRLQLPRVSLRARWLSSDTRCTLSNAFVPHLTWVYHHLQLCSMLTARVTISTPDMLASARIMAIAILLLLFPGCSAAPVRTSWCYATRFDGYGQHLERKVAVSIDGSANPADDVDVLHSDDGESGERQVKLGLPQSLGTSLCCWLSSNILPDTLFARGHPRLDDD